MALRESATTTSVTSVASARYTLRSTTSDVAPRSMASWAKLWPSTTLPTMQKNISPGATALLRKARPSTGSAPLPIMVQSIPSKSSSQVLVMTRIYLYSLWSGCAESSADASRSGTGSLDVMP